METQEIIEQIYTNKLFNTVIKAAEAGDSNAVRESIEQMTFDQFVNLVIKAADERNTLALKTLMGEIACDKISNVVFEVAKNNLLVLKELVNITSYNNNYGAFTNLQKEGHETAALILYSFMNSEVSSEDETTYLSGEMEESSE